MELSHGSFSDINLAPLSHLGTLESASLRLDSIYCALYRIQFDGETIEHVDKTGRPVARLSFTQAAQNFAQKMKQARIWDVEINISNPLRLHDCWTDDPIGSGAMAIFQGNTQLNKRQLDELRSIFFPFEDEIYPDHVHAVYKTEDINKINRTFNANALYKRELQKRKTRLESIHPAERVAYELKHEVIWTTLTLKLREWALKQGFDSFVYENISESADKRTTDSYVILKNDAVGPIKRTYIFNDALYMQVDALTLKDMLEAMFSVSGPGVQTSVFGYIEASNATKFWSLKP